MKRGNTELPSPEDTAIMIMSIVDDAARLKSATDLAHAQVAAFAKAHGVHRPVIDLPEDI